MSARLRPLLLLAALALVAGLGVGTFTLLSRSLGDTTANPPRERLPAGPVPGEVGVVCFGHVDVEHGIAALAPAQPGRVVEVFVHEDQEVSAKAPLLRLDDRLARFREAEAAAAVRAARAQLTAARQLPAQQRSKIAQQTASVAAARHRLTAARLLLGHKRELAKVGQVNAAEVSAGEEQVKELEEAERAAAEQLAELKRIDPELDVRRVEAEAAAAEARLDEARLAREECVLLAPSAGKVLQLRAAVGQALGGPTDPPPVRFCAAEPRLVRAEVEQAYAYRVTVGQSAEIQDDVSGGRSWRGRVARVGDWFGRQRSVLAEPTELTDVRTLECIVSVEPSQFPLRIGQRVRVKIGRAE